VTLRVVDFAPGDGAPAAAEDLSATAAVLRAAPMEMLVAEHLRRAEAALQRAFEAQYAAVEATLAEQLELTVCCVDMVRLCCRHACAALDLAPGSQVARAADLVRMRAGTLGAWAAVERDRIVARCPRG